MREYLQDKRKRLTLMLILGYTSALSFEFGANLVEQLADASVWSGSRGHAPMRVIHSGDWLTRQSSEEGAGGLQVVSKETTGIAGVFGVASLGRAQTDYKRRDCFWCRQGQGATMELGIDWWRKVVCRWRCGCG